MATQPDLRVWLGCIFTRRGRYGKREHYGALQNAFSREESIRQAASPRPTGAIKSRFKKGTCVRQTAPQ